MQIFLHKVRQDQPITITELVELDIRKEVPGLIHLEPVRVNAQLEKQETHLFSVQAKQRTKSTLTCSRCLTEFELPMEADWVELFTDVEYMARETEEQDIFLVENQTIDLFPFIREACLLQIPLAPVCREDCQGICPKCGINKNVATCDCDTTRIDPRLAKLQELLKKDEDE
ncbi:YceD family protein [Thermoflavimicrobium dichotomicum]|uniref:DUF177 domain-containing protein n=1 Tax=Thermoflavimicrobium dichotomicum TaxID=46223 RepID=A0A1I3SS46_9BACL|nr:DUF177 domain-containing protein [Thermoflavimicrobium dichotomicum]SFJ61223.1 uncharacterized protein SAMN05421852_11413 [Thermoflavimicrobium dichotomicum]